MKVMQKNLPPRFLGAPINFFDLVTPSMRNIDARKEEERTGENSSTVTLLPVNRLNRDRLQY